MFGEMEEDDLLSDRARWYFIYSLWSHCYLGNANSYMMYKQKDKLCSDAESSFDMVSVITQEKK